MRLMKNTYRTLSTLCKGGTIEQQESVGVFKPDEKSIENRVFTIYPDTSGREFQGFGGALTEASGSVLEQLPPEKREEIISGYYGPDGIGYTWARTHIDSCDFSLSPYSSLSVDPGGCTAGIISEIFSAHDGRYIIPYLRKADALLQDQGTGALRLCLVPWSPPAFMKDNNRRDRGGSLLPNYRRAWSEYLCRYVEEYKKQGLQTTVLGVQNEPNAAQLWDSCCWSAEELREFIRDFLHPGLLAHRLEAVRISIWDHNRERSYEHTREVCRDEVRELAGAVCFHWYSGDHFENIRLLSEEYPELLLIFSEGCVEYKHYAASSSLENARMYAHNIIGDLNHGAQVWIDWNMVLADNGGPNHAGNFCDAPVMVNSGEGTYAQMLSYYYIGHFSRFIKPGARRLPCSGFTNQLEATAWKNPDGTRVFVILNLTDDDQEFILRTAPNAPDVPLAPDAPGTPDAPGNSAGGQIGQVASLLLPGESIMSVVF